MLWKTADSAVDIKTLATTCEMGVSMQHKFMFCLALLMGACSKGAVHSSSSIFMTRGAANQRL